MLNGWNASNQTVGHGLKWQMHLNPAVSITICPNTQTQKKCVFCVQTKWIGSALILTCTHGSRFSIRILHSLFVYVPIIGNVIEFIENVFVPNIDKYCTCMQICAEQRIMNEQWAFGRERSMERSRVCNEPIEHFKYVIIGRLYGYLFVRSSLETIDDFSLLITNAYGRIHYGYGIFSAVINKIQWHCRVRLSIKHCLTIVLENVRRFVK